MECPYCRSSQTRVSNSRPTRGLAQIWRRRHCFSCGSSFTTHEVVDLSHLVVVKKSGKSEMFSRVKLYSGIYGATIGSRTPNRENVVEKLTREVEREILYTRKKKITSSEIADIVLSKLRRGHTATFLRFLAYCRDITTEASLRREFAKYLPRLE